MFFLLLLLVQFTGGKLNYLLSQYVKDLYNVLLPVASFG